jgi:hypothetical protein
MPVEFMTDWITPVHRFYVRNHMFEPAKLDAKAWSLTIGGEVEKPLTLTLAELQEIAVRSITNTLECAGNGLSWHSPKVPGIKWGKGAVGNAKFSGPSLKTLLEKASVQGYRQTRPVPRTRSGPRPSAAVCAQHSDRESHGRRHPGRDPYERCSAYRASWIPGARRHAWVGGRGFLQMAEGNHGPRQTRRSVQQRLSQVAWSKEMDKMIKCGARRWMPKTATL